MSKLQTPFRYDYVGSFLRLEKLKRTRREFDEGKIPYEELKAVEDEAITELVKKIKELGYHVITDGEFRRATWKYYSSDEELVGDIVSAYGTVIQDLYTAGCRNIQLDDCTWGMMADKTGHLAYGTTQEGLAAIQKSHKDINNLVIANAPKDMIINTHICRGNYHSTYASSGAYDAVAGVLFGEENVNAYFLEFDDERSGGFAPLAKVSGDKKVVLGLITSKSPVLEEKGNVIARIHEAAKYVPLDRLCLSPQCGFASCEIGNKLTEEEQWAKLRLVKEIAEEVWKN